MTGRTLGGRKTGVFHKKHPKPTVWFFLIVSCSFKRVFKISSGKKWKHNSVFEGKKSNIFSFSPFKSQRSHSSWPMNTWIPTILNTEYLNSEVNWILVTSEYSNFQVNWIQSEYWIQGFAKLRASQVTTEWILNTSFSSQVTTEWIVNWIINCLIKWMWILSELNTLAGI